MMSDHEVTKAYIVYLSYEDGKPTLWDGPGKGRTKAIWLESTSGEIAISNDEDVVAEAEGLAHG